MVIELLLLLIVLWIYSGTSALISDKDQDKITQIKQKLDVILLEFEKVPPFSLHLTESKSHVIDKSNIYLVIRRDDKYFDDQTLLSVALHELSHVICPDYNHSSLFYAIEEELQSVAREKGYLTPNFIPDENYPCSE